MRAVILCAVAVLAGCGRYSDFTLPAPAGSGSPLQFTWQPRATPVLERGPTGDWDSGDVLNPSVVSFHGRYLNLYSGFDGKTWHTGLATSADGLTWSKQGKVLSPDPATWEGDSIAGNGAVVAVGEKLLYFYQAGTPPRIGLATSTDGRSWQRHGAAVVDLGPRGSWDERGDADPDAIQAGGKLYLYYLGQDRARRQRLGVAVSDDGVVWTKLRSNPILEPGEAGEFDENGVGEAAVWPANGFYWMLYTGRAHDEVRRLGMARSRDGVHWEKLKHIFSGDQAWDSKVICDPSVLPGADGINVWFGGGDVARPDQNIHGQIGFGILR